MKSRKKASKQGRKEGEGNESMNDETVILETSSCPPVLGAARDNAFRTGACRGGVLDVLAHRLALMLDKPSVGMQRYLFSATSSLNLSLFCSHTPRQ